MRIAIIGAGISGLSLAHYLSQQFPNLVRGDDADFSLQIFEAGQYPGGHTRTIAVSDEDDEHQIDMGFIVFNDRTYPNFCQLLDELKVESQPSPMSFSVSCQATGLEYRGIGLGGLFAQRTNLANPRFLKMLLDWSRFNRIADQFLKTDDHELTVNKFFSRYSFGAYFREKYFFPMSSAVWSASETSVGEFPIRFVMQFYKNHGLLGFDMPQWRVIKGGSQTYVKALIKPFEGRLNLNSCITKVEPRQSGVSLQLASGQDFDFDHVVFACHSDQALKLLGAACPALQQSVLKNLRFESNVVTLHTDNRMMPKNHRAWASWNYFIPSIESESATVTYYMNKLQGLNSKTKYLVSLNRENEIDSDLVLDQVRFSHPVFNADRYSAQKQHDCLIDRDRMSFCGAYWGNGFHEDGVSSALKVFNQLKSKVADAQLHLRGLGPAPAI